VTVCFFLFIPIRYVSILLSVAIAVGLYFFFLGVRVLAGKRSLLTLPTSKIRSATRGLIEVSGVAAGSRTTLAPITGEPCFLYRTTAWQHCEGEKNAWKKVADETLHLPFYIDDSTGQLLIEALGADLDLQPRFRREYVVSLLDPNDVPPNVGVFLSRHGIALDRDLCIEERLIKAEDALFVAGTLTENPGVQGRPSSPGSDLGTDRRNLVCNAVGNTVGSTILNRDSINQRGSSARNASSEAAPAPQIVRLDSGAAPSSTREMSQQAKIAAALTRAGMAGPQAWSSTEPLHQSLAADETEPPAILSARSGHSEIRLREVRLREAQPSEDHPNEGQAESSDPNHTPPLVLMKGVNDPTFVISFRSQKELVTAFAWKSAAMVCGGTAVMLLGLYVLWAQMASV